MPSARWDLDTRKNEINLSFDDGPDPSSTPQILNLLSKYNIKATFFLLGEQVEAYPSLYKEIKSEGHQIGNHGYKHLDGWKTNSDAYLSNTEKGADITMSTMFRPPYGRMSPSQYLRLDQNHNIIMWSLMPGDFDTQLSPTEFLHRLTTSTQGGDIIVLHNQQHAASLLAVGLQRYVEVIRSQHLSISTL